MHRLFAAAWPHLLISLLLVAPRSKAASSFGTTAGRPEWQVLTRANFSSQIRLHPHVLLVVTMPWYGESRSLMAEIEQLVATDEMELGRLKLMVVYINSEKLLSDAIGATEGTKFIYYQQSIQFKYQGKLRARDILYSIRYTMSLKHEEAPFVVLHTKEDAEAFIQSTDRAVLLSEFCGWFTRLASGGSSRSNGVTPSKTDTENENDGDSGLPAIYMMDCTANDCHHLLKSADKEELYPTLLLFPAENKSAISYEGGMSVGNLIEFLESHTSNSRHMLEYKGFLRKKRMVMQHDAPQTIQFHMNDKGSGSVGSDPPSQLEKHKVHIVTGSILGATEKLSAAVPFDNARVLIVSADSHAGFHGLIINKRLSWDTLKNLDSSLEPIKLAPLFYGGPVVVQGYHLVSLSRVALEGYTQVIPDLYYGNIIATSRVITGIKAGEQSAKDLWFFLGYAGWGFGQLFDEVSEGAWHVSGGPIRHLEWPES